MFENLIAQPAGALLAADVATARLPPSILFYGQTASGKLTAALELARVLSCAEGSAKWTCTCPSCRHHKEMTHPDVIVIGSRDCILEIRASAAAFLRSSAPAARFLFVRSVRKLLLRFNPAILDQDDSRLARASSLLAELDELLEELNPAAVQAAEPAALEKTVAAIVESAAKLEDDFLYDSIPVGQIRNASSWVRLSPAGKKKVLILENADRMQESARNAFLKVLEEPPADAVFILTTARRGAIMPTILSRVRTYAFVDRDLPAQAEVITRVFHDSPSDGESLQSYFYRFLPVSAATIDDAARRYVRKVLVDAMDEGKKPLEALPAAIGSGGEPIGPQGAVALLNKCKPGILYRLFLTRIAHYMRVALRSGAADREAAVFAAWTRSIREALDASEVYNIAPASALESLAQAMKESL